MLQAVQVFLHPFASHWIKIKVLTNKNTNDDNAKEKNIEDAAVEYEWICYGYATHGSEDEIHNIICNRCTIPASSGLFGWYRSIYNTDSGKPLDEHAVFYSSPAAADIAEHMNAPPPPLDKRRTMLIEGVTKDAIFGERVEWIYRCVGTYPIGIGKTEDDNGHRELLNVHFKAEYSQRIK